MPGSARENKRSFTVILLQVLRKDVIVVDESEHHPPTNFVIAVGSRLEAINDRQQTADANTAMTRARKKDYLVSILSPLGPIRYTIVKQGHAAVAQELRNWAPPLKVPHIYNNFANPKSKQRHMFYYVAFFPHLKFTSPSPKPKPKSNPKPDWMLSSAQVS